MIAPESTAIYKVRAHLLWVLMQVTKEDGGRLNAFAKEPRMQLMDAAEARPSNKAMIIGGLVLVLSMVVIAAGLS